MSECNHGNMTAHGNPCPWCRNSELEARIHEAIEIYAGMEGFVPETAAEAYCLRIIEQIMDALKEQGDD